MWVEPDIRDTVVGYVGKMGKRSGLSKRWFIEKLDISASKYHSWEKRYGQPNNHNGQIPRFFWTLEEEKASILAYFRERVGEGYRRLSYQMIDADIAAVSPSTVYRVLKENGLLQRWNTAKAGGKGKGFIQPQKVHEHWHTDIAYVNVRGTFLYLISVMDGYSRMILHHELRRSMSEYDVQITLQRAMEKFPAARPRLITDNGSQFVCKDFKEYLRECHLKHVRTSVNYPQSNGKIERYHRTIKEEAVRKQSYVSLEDARRQVDAYVRRYNEERLHSALYYLTPKEVFEGRMEQRLAERQFKLNQAAEKRKNLSLMKG